VSPTRRCSLTPLRAHLARGGRELIEERLCTEVQAPRFADVIERALG
jgi:hypothetical protein